MKFPTLPRVSILAGWTVLALAGAASAQITVDNPRLAMPASHLRADNEAPILIAGHCGVGGGFQDQHGLLNAGASLIFRPGAAANFLDFLYAWRTGMVLQLDHQRLGEGSRLVSGDLILRRYFGNRGADASEVMPFIGVGAGASDLRRGPAAPGGSARYWSGVLEAGQEWFYRPGVVVVAKAQLRYFSSGPVRATTWAVSAGIGLPVPW